MVKKYIPERGDFIWLEFTPQKRREQAKTRPALVLSPGKYNKVSSLALVCPITSKYRGWGFEVALPDGLEATGSILGDQIKSLDYQARKAKFMGKCPSEIVEDVISRVRTLLD